MDSIPRITNRIRIFTLTVTCALALAPVLAQQRESSPKQPARTERASEAARSRRTEAIDLLVASADAARTLDDLVYRARIQLLAADALWPVDEQRARTIFRRAWEAASAADKAEQEEAVREFGFDADGEQTSTAIRDEVIERVAARDTRLADVFLRELLKEKEDVRSAEQNRSRRRTPWRELSAAGRRRLALAYDLLGRNEPARAARIASPAINEGASGELIAFIQRLREQSATDADALYMRLIAQASADTEADANDALLLSSPIVSPRLLLVMDESGSLQLHSIAPTASKFVRLAPVAPNARTAFYDFAAAVLLRPMGTRAVAASSQESTALYFAIARLLSFFESEAAQYAPELRARRDALANQIEARRRDMLSTQSGLNLRTSEREQDPLGPLLERRGQASDQQERDRLSVAIVKTAVQNRSWPRARRAAADIEDAGARRAALSFIAVSEIADVSRAYAEDKEEDFESVVKFVKGADVPPLAGAWGLAQAAVIASLKGKPQRASALIDEAGQYVARVDARTSQRVAAYGIVMAAAARVDTAHAWRILPELVKAANALEDYAGDEVSLDISANEMPEEATVAHFSVAAETFRLDKIFATMAHLDFDKALAQARALQGGVPRAIAQIAIARAALERKTGDRP